MRFAAALGDAHMIVEAAAKVTHIASVGTMPARTHEIGRLLGAQPDEVRDAFEQFAGSEVDLGACVDLGRPARVGAIRSHIRCCLGSGIGVPAECRPSPGRGSSSVLTLDAAERDLKGVGGTFFSTADAACRLGIGTSAAVRLLVDMQSESLSHRVCADGWVLTVARGRDRLMPLLSGYLHDMMAHLGVGYYLSYAAAAELRGASHHGVMRQRVNVETGDLGALRLSESDGPADLAVSFHRIGPQHGRPVSSVRTFYSSLSDDEPLAPQVRTLRVATPETVMLDMVEHPERCGGFDHIATISKKMLVRKLPEPVLLAETSDLYAAQVARRTGSMLQRIRSLGDRFPLRPLARHVRRRSGFCHVELRSAEPDESRRPDRWGVTCKRPLDPDA